MNKRFIELAEQAGFVYNFDPVTWMKHEKFAELIVRECADLLKKEAESSHDEGTETYNLLLKESKWMKKHFGVEE